MNEAAQRRLNQMVAQVTHNEVERVFGRLFDREPALAHAIAKRQLGEALERIATADVRVTMINAFTHKGVFEQTKPAWAPELPLDPLACRALRQEGGRVLLVGQFGDSLRRARWTPRHPAFRDYARFLMACSPAWLQGLWTDPELVREFPPRWFSGSGITLMSIGPIAMLGET